MDVPRPYYPGVGYSRTIPVPVNLSFCCLESAYGVSLDPPGSYYPTPVVKLPLLGL